DRHLIEIARVVVVDRAPQPRAQIPDRLPGGARRALQRGYLGQRLRWKLGIEATLPHGADRNRAQLRAVGLRRIGFSHMCIRPLPPYLPDRRREILDERVDPGLVRAEVQHADTAEEP